MHTYVLPLLINNRREVNVRLATGGWTDGKQYITELRPEWQSGLLSLAADTVLRATYEGGRDLPVHSLRHESAIVDGGVLLRLFTDEAITKPAPTAAPAQEAEKATPLTYEDLEALSAVRPAPAPAQQPGQPVSPAIKARIGELNEHVTAWLITDERGGLHLTATGHGDLGAFCATDAANLTVRILLETDGQTRYCDVRISLATPGQLVSVALDFGSESSQMTVKRSDDGAAQSKKPNAENLFQNVLSFHKAAGWIPPEGPESFYQEEPGTSFYKSVFFLKEDLTGQYEDVGRELFIRNRKDDLKMLVNTHDGFTTLGAQRFRQLPNLKLTHKYDELFSKISFSITKQGYQIPISLGDVKGKVYNTILKTLLESFLKKEFIRYEGATRKVRLVLLVPNIYEFNDVKATQRLLRDIFQDLATHEYAGRLLAWEVLTVSESDAALLGYVNKNPDALGSNRDYIIVDCGKGTTDLSVMRTGPDGATMEPIFRNGFAGAGNLITYAVFETVLHHIRASASDDAAARRFIRDKVLAVLNSSDLPRKTRFYQQLERLKFSYREISADIRTRWSAASVGDLRFRNLATSGAEIDSLTDLLEQLEHLADFYGYIGQATAMIAEKAAGNIALIKENQPGFSLGGVLLTGRAFLFEPLARAMQERLQALLQVDAGRIMLLRGQELKDISVKGVFNRAIRINAEKTGFPIEVYFGTPVPQAATAEPAPEKKSKSWHERLFQSMFNDLAQLQQAEAVIISDKPLGLARLMRSQILIGANRYRLLPPADYNLTHHNDAKADLIFTPDGWMARQIADGTVARTFPLEEVFDTEVMEQNMVLPSLFPSLADEAWVASLQREDIRRLPIIPDPPPSRPAENKEPKGPMYF